MLYRLVQQQAQRFFSRTEETTGAGLPQFVRDAFDAFLECGSLAHGFLRLRQAECGGGDQAQSRLPSRAMTSSSSTWGKWR